MELLTYPMTNINSGGLTYGVELELVFAFHQDELLLELKKDTHGVKYSIEKNIPYFERETPAFTPMILTGLPNHVYNSWGLSYIHNTTHEKKIIPYIAQPMNIVGRMLREKYPGFKFKARRIPTEEEKTKDKYGEWTVTSDGSVCGVGSENIQAWLGRDDIDAAESWDSYGIEMVSRVLASDSSEDRCEIAKVVDVVKGGSKDNYGAFITNQ